MPFFHQRTANAKTSFAALKEPMLLGMMLWWLLNQHCLAQKCHSGEQSIGSGDVNEVDWALGWQHALPVLYYYLCVHPGNRLTVSSLIFMFIPSYYCSIVSRGAVKVRGGHPFCHFLNQVLLLQLMLGCQFPDQCCCISCCWAIRCCCWIAICCSNCVCCYYCWVACCVGSSASTLIICPWL